MSGEDNTADEIETQPRLFIWTDVCTALVEIDALLAVHSFPTVPMKAGRVRRSDYEIRRWELENSRFRVLF